MRAAAKFSDPGAAQISITIEGTLAEFEALRANLGEGRVEFWRVSQLIEQIDHASRRLRYRVDAPEPPRAMVAGDLGA